MNYQTTFCMLLPNYTAKGINENIKTAINK